MYHSGGSNCSLLVLLLAPLMLFCNSTYPTVLLLYAKSCNRQQQWLKASKAILNHTLLSICLLQEPYEEP